MQHEKHGLQESETKKQISFNHMIFIFVHRTTWCID